MTTRCQCAGRIIPSWSKATGMNSGAVAVAVHRLRTRYRELVRREIADTVANPGDVDDEMRHLLAALSGGTGA